MEALVLSILAVAEKLGSGGGPRRNQIAWHRSRIDGTGAVGIESKEEAASTSVPQPTALKTTRLDSAGGVRCFATVVPGALSQRC